MSIRAALDSIQISDDYNVSDSKTLRVIIDKIGDVFLIIYEENGVKYRSLHTRKELRLDGIPAGYFHRPVDGLKFHVLVREHRNFETLKKLNWI